MADIWSTPAGTSDGDGLDYWGYFGLRLVEHAADGIHFTKSVLFATGIK